MGREIKLPVPRFPERLPFESVLERASLALGKKVERFPLIKLLDVLGNAIPYPAESKIGTPFGDVKLPPLNIPSIRVPELDDRRREAFRASVGKDIAELLQMIPFVGQYISEPIADTYAAKIQESMTEDENTEYKRWEKKSPFSIVAVIQTFIRK